MIPGSVASAELPQMIDSCRKVSFSGTSVDNYNSCNLIKRRILKLTQIGQTPRIDCLHQRDWFIFTLWQCGQSRNRTHTVRLVGNKRSWQQTTPQMSNCHVFLHHNKHGQRPAACTVSVQCNVSWQERLRKDPSVWPDAKSTFLVWMTQSLLH